MAKHSVISLYSGIGGLDLGLELAGYKTHLCVEIDELCRSTLSANRPQWRLSEPGDVFRLTTSSILKQAGLRKGKLDLLVGGPPCQPYSKSGYWVNGDAKRLSDPRADTLRRYLELVGELRPRVFLLENVPGFNYKNKDEAKQYLEKKIRSINKRLSTRYTPVTFKINAADYGVPQIRERVFVIAHRDGLEFSVPAPTHGPKTANPNDVPYMTAWDAIGDLDTDHTAGELAVGGKWADLLPSIPEGKNYLWHTPRSGGVPLFGWRRKFWSFLLKLAKGEPSWTIQASPGSATGPFHWKNRKLSMRELCRLQTIPDDYTISGLHRQIQMQIGNAVPSALAELLGLEIRRQFFSERVRRKLRALPDKQDYCPKAEKLGAVPSKYYSMNSLIKDHPGIGRGPGKKAV